MKEEFVVLLVDAFFKIREADRFFCYWNLKQKGLKSIQRVNLKRGKVLEKVVHSNHRLFYCEFLDKLDGPDNLERFGHKGCACVLPVLKIRIVEGSMK